MDNGSSENGRPKAPRLRELRVDDEGPLRVGDVVEVRPLAEILETLDDDAATDGMPFMPEMLRYAGRRFTVSRRVEKICDTVSGAPPNSRRMRDTVLLDDLRCDGQAHGGCQAGCRLYWREDWLRRVDPESPQPVQADDAAARRELERRAQEATRAVGTPDDDPIETYRCQATEALEASEPMGNYDLRQYLREIAAGNIGPLRLLRVAAHAISFLVRRRLHLLPYQPLEPPPAPPPSREALDLQPGDFVRVRPPEEIAQTIDEHGKTRGLTFDWEMLPYCGGEYQVRDRVRRIVDERNGRMIEISSDCLILDGVVCSGECSAGHWLCPRGIYPYWREAWLTRSGGPASGESGDEVD